MAKSTLDDEIRDRIDSFLTELSGLVKKAALEAVHEALGTSGAPGPRRTAGARRKATSRRRGRPRKARGRVARAGQRIRRSAADLEAIGARVLSHVRANPGHRLEEIGKGLRTATGVLKRPIAKLLEESKLRTEGQKRGTKYFAGGRGRKAGGRRSR